MIKYARVLRSTLRARNEKNKYIVLLYTERNSGAERCNKLNTIENKFERSVLCPRGMRVFQKSKRPADDNPRERRKAYGARVYIM